MRLVLLITRPIGRSAAASAGASEVIAPDGSPTSTADGPIPGEPLDGLLTAHLRDLLAGQSDPLDQESHHVRRDRVRRLRLSAAPRFGTSPSRTHRQNSSCDASSWSRRMSTTAQPDCAASREHIAWWVSRLPSAQPPPWA